jgi:HlyD family secretion protein
LDAANESKRKHEERLARYRQQVEKCKVYAPRDGIVVYASPKTHGESIREGVAIRPRQQILSLPNLNRMQLRAAIRESLINQVKVGMPVLVRVVAFPDRTYRGTVQNVAALSDYYKRTRAKENAYQTIVTIDDEVEELMPGMTAIIQIEGEVREGVLSLPKSAVLQTKDACWCYVRAEGGIERRSLKVGKRNEQRVEIREGLAEGEQVVLNPASLNIHAAAEPPRQ